MRDWCLHNTHVPACSDGPAGFCLRPGGSLTALCLNLLPATNQIPFDLLVTAFDPEAAAKSGELLKVLRLARLVRLSRLFKVGGG